MRYGNNVMASLSAENLSITHLGEEMLICNDLSEDKQHLPKILVDIHNYLGRYMATRHRDGLETGLRQLPTGEIKLAIIININETIF